LRFILNPSRDTDPDLTVSLNNSCAFALSARCVYDFAFASAGWAGNNLDEHGKLVFSHFLDPSGASAFWADSGFRSRVCASAIANVTLFGSGNIYFFFNALRCFFKRKFSIIGEVTTSGDSFAKSSITEEKVENVSEAKTEA
jgi:hypothetical protein